MSLAMYRRIVYTYCNELEKKIMVALPFTWVCTEWKVKFHTNFSVWFATRMDGDLYFVLIIELKTVEEVLVYSAFS